MNNFFNIYVILTGGREVALAVQKACEICMSESLATKKSP